MILPYYPRYQHRFTTVTNATTTMWNNETYPDHVSHLKGFPVEFISLRAVINDCMVVGGLDSTLNFSCGAIKRIQWAPPSSALNICIHMKAGVHCHHYQVRGRGLYKYLCLNLKVANRQRKKNSNRYLCIRFRGAGRPKRK